MRENIDTYLDEGIFPTMTPTPIGLEATKNGLVITSEMAYIKEAMKMRISGSGFAEICAYLKENDISVSENNIAISIFKNELYV